MKAKGLVQAIGFLLLCSASAPSMAASFSISANNVTMPRSGTASSQFAISSIPMTGDITLSCSYSGKLSPTNLPVCPLTPAIAYQVTAGGALTGSVVFYPAGVAVPASIPGGGVAAAALALCGLGLLRWRRRWSSLVSLAVLGAAGLMGVSACGGNNGPVMPAGTYPYTITAENTASINNLAAGASVTIQVTVP
ncbi:MAG TPA: hypothetical protein VK716_05565 [Terracidiphilus sp.]|jgi:hypothetical protein|nr:hypothetical protein [Terracidiphilus sp.]